MAPLQGVSLRIRPGPTVQPWLQCALVLTVLALCWGGAEAQGYWVIYPSNCAAVCSPASLNSGSYTSCQSNCNTCLLNYGCYSEFYPYFGVTNGLTFYTYSLCECYWPWWAWLLLASGLFCVVCICCPFLLIYLFCKGIVNRARKDETQAAPPPPPQQPYMPGTAPYPDAATMPPPPPPQYGAGAPPAYGAYGAPPPQDGAA